MTPTLPVWDDAPWAPLPHLAGALDADVCVVGLGGSGLACVGALRAAGARVVGVDAGAVAGGAAGRNGGFLLAGLAPFYHDLVARVGRDLARRLYALTLGEIDRMAAESPDLVRRVGSLRVAASDDEAEDCAQHLAALRADGFPAEPYDGPEGRGILIPTDGVFQPLARCRLLARRALDAGAYLFEHSPAVAITADGAGRRVDTPHATVRCARVVVAVDGGLERVAPELAGRVRTARLQMLATAPAPEVHFPRPVYRRWGYDYWQQLPDGRVVLGGFRDRVVDAEWTHDRAPTAAVQAHAERLLREALGVRAAVTRRWAASVGYTESGLPVLEEVRPGVMAAGGYSGTGNVVGALCGRAAAAWALGGRAPVADALAEAWRRVGDEAPVVT